MHNPPLLTTSRLLLRPATLADAKFFVELLNSEPYLRFIADRKVRTAAEAKVYIQKQITNEWEVHGLGYLVVEQLESKMPLGIVGIKQRNYLELPDLGFAFLPNSFGKGYASEAAEALLFHASEEMQVKTIHAITDKTNKASLLLIESLGFTLDGEVTPIGEEEAILLFSKSL